MKLHNINIVFTELTEEFSGDAEYTMQTKTDEEYAERFDTECDFVAYAKSVDQFKRPIIESLV